MLTHPFACVLIPVTVAPWRTLTFTCFSYQQMTKKKRLLDSKRGKNISKRKTNAKSKADSRMSLLTKPNAGEPLVLRVKIITNILSKNQTSIQENRSIYKHFAQRLLRLGKPVAIYCSISRVINHSQATLHSIQSECRRNDV